MCVTEQNRANRASLSSENIGPVLMVKFLKQEITVQKKSCLHYPEVSQILQALLLKTCPESALMQGSGEFTFGWSGRSYVEARSTTSK